MLLNLSILQCSNSCYQFIQRDLDVNLMPLQGDNCVKVPMNNEFREHIKITFMD